MFQTTGMLWLADSHAGEGCLVPEIFMVISDLPSRCPIDLSQTFVNHLICTPNSCLGGILSLISGVALGAAALQDVTGGVGAAQ